MIVISHRGNLFGPNPTTENSSNQILECINKKIQVEIDVWNIDGSLFLGHDEPVEKIQLDFLLNYKEMLWIHTKNAEALNYLLDFKQLNVFWHQSDDYTITTNGTVWTYPNINPVSKSVIVCQTIYETKKYSSFNIEGICTDYVNSVTKVL